MGDTPSGVVARRTCPSGVASSKVGSQMVRGSGVAAGGLCSSWTRLSTCTLFGVGRRCCSWEAVQLLDKVADMPVAAPHWQFVKVVDDPVVQVVVVSVQLDRYRELIVEFSAADHEGNPGSDSACATGSRSWSFCHRS